MEKHETPQSIHRFFQALDAGDAEEARQCEMHYGCACIVQRGRRAAEMLLEIQAALGLEGLGETAAAPPAEAAPNTDELNRQLQAERQKAGGLNEEIGRLARDNERLRDHIRLLQRQLDRLYDRREMNSVLNRIENGREGGTPAGAPVNDTSAEVGRGGSGEVAARSAPATERKRPPATLAETLESEGAMPVSDLPPDERERGEWREGREGRADEQEFPDD